MITEAERARLMEDAAFASAFEKAMNKEVLGVQREYTEAEILKKHERTKQRKCNNAKRHKKRK